MSEWHQHADARLDAPAFHRNCEALIGTAKSVLNGRRGDLLEIGCGSGQHALALALALPDVDIWPTDPAPEHCRSADAWRATRSPANLHRARQLDASSNDWLGEHAPAGPLAAVLCANVLHIAPFAISEALFAGAARHLATDGHLLIYGPFSIHGAHTAPSNAAFDASLRSRDPSWGIRDLDALDHLAAAQDLQRLRAEPMPANNFTLIYAPA